MARVLASDPLRSFKFNLNIPIQVPGVKQSLLTIGFAQVSSIGLTTQVITYQEGGDNTTTRKMPGTSDVQPLQLARGLFPSDPQLWTWFTEIFDVNYGGGANYKQNVGGTAFRADMWLNVLAHPYTSATQSQLGPGGSGGSSGSGGAGQPSFVQQRLVQTQIIFYSAWPMGISYSDFDATTNNVAIEQMTLAYEGFQVRRSGSATSFLAPDALSTSLVA